VHAVREQEEKVWEDADGEEPCLTGGRKGVIGY